MIEIRSARESDATELSLLNREVQSLHARLLPHVFKPAEAGMFSAVEIVAQLQRAESVWLVAVLGEKVLGYAFAEVQEQGESAFRVGRRRLLVHHMAIAARVQRQGLGRRLFAALKQAARARAIDVVALDVWGANAAAQAFYAREGLVVERLYLSLDLGNDADAGWRQ